MIKKIIDAIDERIGIRADIKEQLTEYMVPSRMNFWYSLGAVLLAIFTIEIMTGILLLINYIPSVKEAFDSVALITGTIPFGWLVRRVHVLGSYLFIITLFLHMISVLFMGAYKKPREIQWFLGCMIFGAVMFTCLAGYLLPWSQLSYWATTVGTNFPSSIPVIGGFMVHLVRGGELVSQSTLSRFFTLHVVVIPLLLIFLIGAHIFAMHRTGVSNPPWTTDTTKIPFYPKFFLGDLTIIYIFLAILFFFVFFFPQIGFPPDTLVRANPLLTPEHIKPEWYFLGSYQVIKIIPNKFLGISLQGVIVALIFLLPVIDRCEERRVWKRPIFASCVIFAVVAYVVLTIWGSYS